ncbi:spore germination protein [Paenibacillus protaetiae]|uniref:Spore germination protein n=1 Tax=Paenibacillus protaetiae TaxID=2509456 RepID=A0A4P6EXZ1_9BACL|nr:spore germination protein [Paenibacillus protaetiae]QAY66629.1 spore germination protein [Paenibacillus protaetiae]
MGGPMFYPRGAARVKSIKTMLSESDDIIIQSMMAGDAKPMTYELIFCMGMVDPRSVQDFLLPQMEKLAEWWSKRSRKELAPSHKVEERFESKLITQIDPTSYEEEKQMFASIFSGNVLIVLEEDLLFMFDAADQPSRQPEESTMELSLRGPRDGFVEKISINLALIRGRLKSTDLHCEFRTIGYESMTRVALLYLSGKADPGLIQLAKNRLDRLNINALQNSSELEELLSDRKNSLFPLMDYTGRPDYTVQSLLNGRIAIVVDGSPSVIMAPTSLFRVIKSPEDAHLPFYYVSLERFLRLIGVGVSMCLPGFWVSLSAYNTDQLPFTLLSTVALSRQGLPLSASAEMFMMLFMFELFREAGVRLPRAVGQTVTVVGGLIVGDAAIRAGLTSPTMLVVAAITAVSSFTLVNQTINGSVSIVRLLILLLSSVLGLFGFFVGSLATLVYLCSLKSFGYSYMSPLAPFSFKKLVPGLLQNPWYKRLRRR